jgi:hypothetical protein
MMFKLLTLFVLVIFVQHLIYIRGIGRDQTWKDATESFCNRMNHETAKPKSNTINQWQSFEDVISCPDSTIGHILFNVARLCDQHMSTFLRTLYCSCTKRIL